MDVRKAGTVSKPDSFLNPFFPLTDWKRLIYKHGSHALEQLVRGP